MRRIRSALRFALPFAVTLAIGCGSQSEPVRVNCGSAPLGMAECIEDADCQRSLDSWLEGMGGPRTPWERSIAEARCIMLTVVGAGPDNGAGSACQCRFEVGDGSLSVGPLGVPCLARSRTGNCIWDGSEFPGCEIGTESNCSEFCDRLMEKQREDDLRVFETEAFGAVCEGFSCKSLARVDDQCFFRGRNVGPAPCDVELLAMSEPPVLDPALDMQCEAPPRAYQLRPKDEWQGMRVRLDSLPICDGQASCSMALACKDGKCWPCLTDVDCAQHEVCVLDHCVLETKASCRSYTDCDEGRLCVLSGYSAGYRGNEDMRAYCLSPNAGTAQIPEGN